MLALESSYNKIREQHPEVPAAVIVISSSTGRYGHFAKSRWEVSSDDGTVKLPEIMVSAEGLRRPAKDVLATLIHEAAHGLAHARQLSCTKPHKEDYCEHYQDVSGKGGKYHNKRFKELAEELGLQVNEPVKLLGHTSTSLPEGEHVELLADLEPQLIAWREFDIHTRHPTQGNNRLSLNCRCPRNIQVRRTVSEQGPIMCGVCGDTFE